MSISRSSSSPRLGQSLLQSAIRPVNRLVLLLAGTRFLPLYGVISHGGRRSGKAYRTARAAGECTIRWKDRDYSMVDPEVIGNAPAAAPGFSALERAMMTRLGI